MKKHSININDIPEETRDFTRGQKSPRQNEIYEYIKKHPHCTRDDLYSLGSNDGHIRSAITSMLKSRRVKETFTIVK